jgi:hypothetical protein
MSLRSQLVTLVLATLGAFLTFYLLQRQLVGVLPGSGVAGEVVAALERSQADLGTLARSDPARRGECTLASRPARLANRLRIVDHNREEIARGSSAAAGRRRRRRILAFGGRSSSARGATPAASSGSRGRSATWPPGGATFGSLIRIATTSARSLG